MRDSNAFEGGLKVLLLIFITRQWIVSAWDGVDVALGLVLP